MFILFIYYYEYFLNCNKALILQNMSGAIKINLLDNKDDHNEDNTISTFGSLLRNVE